jgi:two-component system catabolic regulation response regulator CreB
VARVFRYHRAMKKILIVEDEASIADSISYALHKDGFHPEHAMLGELALQRLRQGDVALVILDVGLPDISGLDVCRRLRQFSEVPVIFLTARSEEIDRVVGLEIGADDYVTKPFSPRELVARVRVILRRVVAAVPALPAKPVAVGFELRAAEARVLYGGRPLELTRYEFLLLQALLEHPGHVLSRAQLMDRVWHDAGDTLDRTVDAHVKSVRAKVRAIDPAADPIQTHRGMGYSCS